MSIKSISCIFQGSDKPYSYLTSDNTIKVGDYVLVESNKFTNRVIHNVEGLDFKTLNILSTLEVVGINPVLKNNIKYKKIIQKIDLDGYFNG